MAKKKNQESKTPLCPHCKIPEDEGFITTNNSAVFWSKGKHGIFKSLFSKAQPVIVYSCPKCGHVEMKRVIKK